MARFPIPGWVGVVQKHWGSALGGSDLFAARSATVVAPESGTVVDAGYSSIGGNNLTLKTPSGLIYYMAHLDSLAVKAGQVVSEGVKLGEVGDTGNAKGTGPHLHIGIGYGIVNGSGALGGTGLGFNAVEWLTSLLAESTAPGKTPTPGMPEPSKPAGPAQAEAPSQNPGFIPSIPDPTDTLKAIAEQIKAVNESLTAKITGVFSTLEWFGQVNLWKRLGIGALGAAMILVGLVLFALSFQEAKQVVKAAAAVV